MAEALPKPNSSEDEGALMRVKEITAFRHVAFRRRATSAQPQRTTPIFYPGPRCPLATQPTPSSFFARTNGTPQEGLRCFPVCRSLYRFSSICNEESHVPRL